MSFLSFASGSFTAALTMSRSRARVSATYRRRISSDSSSLSALSFMAIRAREGYSIPRPMSTTLGPRPSTGCTVTGDCESFLLKRRAVSHRNTTGNSRPLDLCTVIICTASPVAPRAMSSPRSASFLSHSLKRCRPRKPPFSKRFASSSIRRRLEQRSSPSGIAAHSAMRSSSSYICRSSSPGSVSGARSRRPLSVFKNSAHFSLFSAVFISAV